MKSRASYVGTTAQPCSTCQVATPVDGQHFMFKKPKWSNNNYIHLFVVIVNLTKLLSQICFKAVTTESDWKNSKDLKMVLHSALTAHFKERSTNWKSCFVLTHSSSGFSNTNCHRQTAIKLYEVKVFPLAANTGINSTPVHNEEKPRYNCWFLIQCRS